MIFMISIKSPKHHSMKVFGNAVLDFVIPLTAEGALLVGLLDAAGSVSSKKSKLKEAAIGHMEVLQL